MLCVQVTLFTLSFVCCVCRSHCAPRVVCAGHSVLHVLCVQVTLFTLYLMCVQVTLFTLSLMCCVCSSHCPHFPSRTVCAGYTVHTVFHVLCVQVTLFTLSFTCCVCRSHCSHCLSRAVRAVCRSPTHPFITVLTHRPAAWPLLTSQVEQLALHHDIRYVNRNVIRGLVRLAPYLGGWRQQANI